MDKQVVKIMQQQKNNKMPPIFGGILIIMCLHLELKGALYKTFLFDIKNFN